MPHFATRLGSVLDVLPAAPSVDEKAERAGVRILTYNVRGCRGGDGIISTGRIADAIREHDPDIVALQELDSGRKRSGCSDQADEIAAHLGMSSHFHPAHCIAKEQYGDAILSRLPIRLKRAGLLPSVRRLLIREERGAIWVEVRDGKHSLQVINTHLGLGRTERRLQAEALLGPEWCGAAALCGPVILCGDFNSPHGGVVYRRIAASMRDAALLASGRRDKTYPAAFPLLCIDHIFISERLHSLRASVPRTALARRASDHYPVLCEISILPETNTVVRGET